jgi:LacI family transcriptional regulator
MKVRIKDIAEKANVSVGTVDRVLHNRGEVSEPTRKKILEIIGDIGYQPDILARTLASRRSYRIAVAIPRPAGENEFWQAPLKGIERALGEINFFGFGIDNYHFDQYDIGSFESACRDILHDRPDALVLAPVFQKESRYFITACREQGIRIVLINSRIEGADYLCYIGQDAFKSGLLAGRLMSCGLLHGDSLVVINMAYDKDNYQHIAGREQGFMSYFNEHQEYHTLKIIRKDLPDTDNRAVGECLGSCFRKYKNIKGIFVTNSRVYKVAGYLSEHTRPGIRLIGYDLIPSNLAYLRNGVIDYLISQKPEEQGYQAIMNLFSHLILKREIQKIQHMPIDIITRENLEYYGQR